MFPKYCSVITRKARKEAWDVVFANRPLTVLLGFLGTCIAVYFGRRTGVQSPDQMRDAAISFVFGLIAMGLIYALSFLVHFLYYTPKHIAAELKTDRDNLKIQLDDAYDLRIKRRQKEREDLAERCIKMLKDQKVNMVSFNAVARHEAYKLEAEDLDWLCDEVEKFYGSHPFTGLDAYVPKADRREFLRWFCLHSDYRVTKETDYLDAAERWRAEHDYPLPPEKAHIAHIFTKTLGGEHISITQPSPKSNTEASPHSPTS